MYGSDPQVPSATVAPAAGLRPAAGVPPSLSRPSAPSSAPLKREHDRLGEIIGASAAMQHVFDLIELAAACDANVVLFGESGTGKELAAHAIHELSARRAGSFVPVNCGAIPETLMESEFFGHRKGAFSGALIDKHGYLDLADGGTLFLDEVGEIGPRLQVKLLRAIDGGGFTPIGGREVKRLDFRIVAATNRNLRALVRRGELREDFFYRIHVLPIHLPPLRERREDIPLLANHFAACFSRGAAAPPLTPRLLEALCGHDWPGNVRELQNTVYRYLALKRLDFASGRESEASGPEPPDGGAASEGLEAMVALYEKKLLLEALAKHRWRREETAAALGIHRKTLFAKMKKHGITPPERSGACAS